nr:hypothetical protein GTC16762_31250 [Pigmentibacter ruber]
MALLNSIIGNETNYSEASFEKVVFCYLDILGFKDKLNKFGTNFIKMIANSFKKSINELNLICQKNNQNIGNDYGSISFKILSDSVLIWNSDISEIGIWNLINVIQLIRSNFHNDGFLIRGAIDIGEHFYDQDILVSPVLIKTYSVESKLAIFPRIIISSETKDFAMKIKFSDCGKSGVLSSDEKKFRFVRPLEIEQDKTDGFFIINQFLSTPETYFLRFNSNNLDDIQPDSINRQRIIDEGYNWYDEYRKSIINEFNKCSDQTIRRKIYYLSQKMNEAVLFCEGRLTNQQIQKLILNL